MERAWLVLVAMLVGGALWGAGRLWPAARLEHWQQWPARLIRAIERRLNRPQRTLKERARRGDLLLAAAVLAGLAAGRLLEGLPAFGGWPLEALVLALLLPVRAGFERASSIRRALEQSDTLQARLGLKDTVWRHHAVLDAHAVGRAAIEMLAVQFSEKWLAPVCWYLLFGLPGLLVSKAVYLLKESLCQPMAAERAFSRSAQAAHMLMHYVPARAGLVLWVLAALFVPGPSLWQALRTLFKTPMRRLAPEAVAVLAAAGSLNVSLGGPTSVYTGGQWYGSGTARVAAGDVRSAQRLWLAAHAIAFVVLGFCA
jgi:adenosylcobinamide-phosphate synthase